jgi:uncharacterized DUF497 family protein
MDIESEWDDQKRRSNLRKHGIDFQDAIDVFDGRPATTTFSDFQDETRFVTIAMVDNKYITIVWTPRGNRIRLISARRSRDAEKRQHHSETRE